MKKLLAIAAVLFLLVVSVRPVSNFLISTSLKNPAKPWAPATAFNCCRALYWVGHHADACAGIEQAIVAFPDHPDVPQAYYWAGVCQENQRNFENARAWYEATIAQYPQHTAATAAQRRLGDMGALGRRGERTKRK
ncbi:MAG: tetratricopeptide repeat protein [Lentisphaeria bacterium]|jgi:TolA-binding protein